MCCIPLLEAVEDVPEVVLSTLEVVNGVQCVLGAMLCMLFRMLFRMLLCMPLDILEGIC